MFIESDLYEKIKNCIPIPCVDVAIVWNGQFLLCKRIQPPAQGQWWFPGGRVLLGESLHAACVRKGLEELNLTLEVQDIVSVEESIFESPRIHTINTVIRAKPLNQPVEVRLDNTHSEYRWFDAIQKDWHPCVISPLKKLGFPYAEG